MRSQPRIAARGVCRILGIAAFAALLFVTGCATKSSPPEFGIVTTSGQLVTGVVNSVYPGATLTAANGTGPYTWSMTPNPVDGLSLSPAGVISGTPTTSGTFNISVTVTDSTGKTATANLSVSINPLLTSVSVTSPVTAGNSTNGTVTMSGPAPTGGSTVNLSGNNASVATVPANVTVAAGATTANFTVTTASGGSGGQVTVTATYLAQPTQTANLTVNHVPTFTSANSTTFNANQAGTFTVTATGTPTPTLAESGALPNNVNFNTTTGVLSGTPAAGTGGAYTITLTATNSVGNTPQTFTLTVDQAPAIATQPVSATVVAGSNATFNAAIAAGAFPVPTVQWQVSVGGGAFTNIAGATSTTLNLNAVTAPMNGNQYQAVFTSAAGTATTSAATLTVNSPPAVTQQPTSQTVLVGANASFTATAGGNPAPTVQWQVSVGGGAFTNIAGATNTTLNLTAVTLAMNGNQYEAVFTNSISSATTSAATLTVNQAPAITLQPTSTTVNAGANPSFTATASGTPAPTVQWQVSVGGGAFTNIAGATNTTLNLTAVTSAMNGNQYQAVFTNAVSSVTTNAATLTVDFAPIITLQPTSQSVGAGGNTSFTATANGNPAPTVQWQVSVGGGAFTNIGGATSTTLNLTAVTAGMNGNQYQAVFTNSVSSTTTSAATLTVTSLPGITLQPTSTTVNAGANVSFTATASGTPAPTVQWQVSVGGGAFTNIAGATSTTLNLNAVTAALNGNQYQAVFTNSSGSVTTSIGTLTVDFAPTITSQPTSQTVGAGGNTSFTATASGNPAPTVQWQVSVGGGAFTNIGGATSTTLNLTAVTAGMNGNQYQAVFTNSVSSTTTSAATLTVTSLPGITLQPTSTTVNAGANVSFTATASGTPAPTVQWQVSVGGGAFTNIGGATSTTLNVNAVTSVMNGNRYQAVFTNSSGSATTNTATLTVDFAPTVLSNPTSQTVPVGSSPSFTASASGNPAPTVQWQVSVGGGAFTNIAGATNTTLNLTAVTLAMNGNQYEAVFTNSISSATTSAATLTVNQAPAITLQPTSTTVNAGASPSFTATASGSPAPTVQWQVSVGGAFTNIAGATSTTLNLTAVTSAMNGNQYQAVFTNAAGSVTTNAATLTVDFAPTISLQPTNQSVLVGANASFTATAGGNPAPTVQWQVSIGGGAFTNIAGATNTTLNLTAVTLAMNGNQYQAVFTNSISSTTTNAATLTVTAMVCSTNCTLSGTVTGPWVRDVTITITGGTQTTTDPNGNYSFTGLAGGTYTVTPSLAGYTYVPSAPSVTLSGSTTVQNFAATPVIASDSVSGTVFYSGAATGVTYINVYQTNCGNCGPVGGTTLPVGVLSGGSAAYTIRGLRQTGNGNQYLVRAEIDTFGTGVLNAADPAGNTSNFLLTSDLTGENVTIGTQTVPSASIPDSPNAAPGNGAAFISYSDPTDSDGDEIATSYNLYYGTSNPPTSKISIPAGNPNNIYVLSGLTNGMPYYFAASAVNVNGESSKSSVYGPVTINATSGTNTISGTVTFAGTVKPNAPLYIGAYSQQQGIYFQRIAPASGASLNLSSGIAYSVGGIPAGNYQFFAVLDQNANGYIDVADVTNFIGSNGPPLISVPVTGAENITLTAANATTFVTTDHQLSSGVDTYNINVGANLELELPVSMTLFSGPNVAVPFDATTPPNNGGGNPIFNNSVRPTAGDTYQFLVTFPNGSTQVFSSQVSAVLNAPQNVQMNSPVAGTATVPVLNWSTPSPVPAVTPYTYNLSLNGGSENENWNYPGHNSGNGIPSTTTSLTFNTDGKASPNSSLTPGNTYNWDVQVRDANGNSGEYDTTYQAPGSVGPPSQLVFTQEPVGAAPGATMPTVQVAIEDASGNIVASATNTITLSLATGGGILTGGGAVSPINGVATFSNLSINTAGTGYTLLATASSPPSLTAALSNSFSVGVTATSLQSMIINPFVVNAGTNPTGTVTLNGNAPTGGAIVTLTSSNTSAATVQNVTVPAGSSSTTFTVTTLTTAAPAQTKISASFNGTNNSQQLWINPPGTPYLSSMKVSPKSVDGGVTTPVLTITLSGPAPSGGAVVAVQSDNPSAVAFGAAETVTVSPGATSGTFNVGTNPVTTITPVSLTGNYNGPAGTSFSVYPSPVVATLSFGTTNAVTGGSTNPTATVTLSGGAPSPGATVSLSSSNGSVASVPTSVVIATGTTSMTFGVTTSVTGSQQTATITATYGGASAQAGLLVTPASSPVLNSLTLSPGAVVGATSGTITGTVTIDNPAVSPGATVTLASNDTSAAQVPASVTIPTGSTSTTFGVTTFATSTNGQTAVILSGTYGGVTQTATLGVDAPLAITTTNLSVAALGLAYPTTSIGHTTGIGPFTYALQSGTNLPNGLTLGLSGSTAGQITGAPSISDTVGNNSFTVTVTDGQSHVSAPVTVTIPVVDPTNACGPASDPRGVLNGGYAALLQGWVTISGVSYPAAEIFRFTANGNGTIGSAGTMDLNTGSSTFPYQQVSILTSSTYSVAADNSGCIQLKIVGTFGGSNTTVNTIVYHFAVTELNGPNNNGSGNNAMIGRIIQFDNYSGTGPNTAGIGFDVAGVLHYQDLSFINFSNNNTVGMASRFGYGTDGEVGSAGAFGHFSEVGSFSLNTSTGAITNLYFDADAAGTIVQGTGGTAQVTSNFLSATTGRGALTFGGSSSNEVFYVLNPNEFYMMETDSVNSYPIQAGRAIVTAPFGSYTTSAQTGNYLIDLTGIDNGVPDATEGIISIGSDGSIIANLNEVETGFYATEGTQPGQSISLDSNSGRTTIIGGGNNNGAPIFYPAVPVLSGTDRTEPIISFLGGSTGDSEALFGFSRLQPSMTYSNGSLPTPFVFGAEENAQDVGVAVGRGTFASGVATVLRDSSGPNGSGMVINNPTPKPPTFAVNSDGTVNGSFNGATQNVGATNGTDLLDITETGIPASIRIWEK